MDFVGARGDIVGKTFEESRRAEREWMPRVKEWLERLLGLVDVSDASVEDQRERDIDLYGEDVKGGKTSFEVKGRGKEYPDLLIETLSCEERKTPGWILKSEADHLVYVFVLEKIDGYIIDMPGLRDWWIKVGRFNDYPMHRGETAGVGGRLLYHTLNRAVPLNHIPYQLFVYHRNYGLLKRIGEELDPSYFR